eukprot:9127604-Alexandrium_andersonii.AAC.1
MVESVVAAIEGRLAAAASAPATRATEAQAALAKAQATAARKAAKHPRQDATPDPVVANLDERIKQMEALTA